VCGASSRVGAAVDPSRLAGVYDELRPLVQLLGPTSALDLLLAGGMLGAERAQLLGLVNRVAPDAGLREQAYGLAARVAAGAPLVNRWHKQAVRRLYGQVPLVL
jgi:enoyl-CoA hydratase/carnithine racemase